MYSFVKNSILNLLKVPSEPLDPMGDVQSLKVFRASPEFMKYRILLWFLKNILFFFGAAIFAGVAVAKVFAGKPKGPEILVFLLAGLVLLVLIFFTYIVISYFMIRLDYEMRWYKLSDRSLRIREGIVFVREMTMTFANIQNISISQGPLQRFFGIADLKVETAGGGSGMIQPANNNQQQVFSLHIGYFRGIDNYDEVRNLMISRLKKMKDTGLGDTVESSQSSKSIARQYHDSPLLSGALKAVLEETILLRNAATNLKIR